MPFSSGFSNAFDHGPGSIGGTTYVDIVNRALQAIGTRTTVSQTELDNNSTNESIQANLVINNIRDDLLRMAPWNFAFKTANLIYITSAPGTPENLSSINAGSGSSGGFSNAYSEAFYHGAPTGPGGVGGVTTLWMPGQPAPPWAYEYQYPVDCLRAQLILPATQTGFSGGVPITTAVTGGAASFWRGPPVMFKVQNDQFVPVIAVEIVDGGFGYTVGDTITMPYGPNTSPPIGAPLQLLVNTVDAMGTLTAVEIISQTAQGITTNGGSYFFQQPNPVAQGTTDGGGYGGTFNLTYGPRNSQRVILTNQEFATLSYVQRVVDPNLMDTLFQSAWANILGATMCMALSGDKKLANFLVSLANQSIATARNPDGNEGLTINNVTPDWIRIRGIDFNDMYNGPYGSFDWGNSWGYY